MTNHDIAMIALGFNLGVLLTLAFYLVGQAIDNRREARADRAALNQARKISATVDWRDVLTVREPA